MSLRCGRPVLGTVFSELLAENGASAVLCPVGFLIPSRSTIMLAEKVEKDRSSNSPWSGIEG